MNDDKTMLAIQLGTTNALTPFEKFPWSEEYMFMPLTRGEILGAIEEGTYRAMREHLAESS